MLIFRENNGLSLKGSLYARPEDVRVSSDDDVHKVFGRRLKSFFSRSSGVGENNQQWHRLLADATLSRRMCLFYVQSYAWHATYQ